MIDALNVRANDPATRGAGVKDAVIPSCVRRCNEDILTNGSMDPVKYGEMRERSSS